MKREFSIVLGVVGVLVCIGLIILAAKMISERYSLLRHVGRHHLNIHNQHKDQIDSDGPWYEKQKFLRHKYSRGTSYDRAKLRLSNRHGRYY